MTDVPPETAGRRRRNKLIKSIRLPRISGKASAAWLVACFALTAALIPMAARLPLWIDFEIVLATWWLIWTGVLTRLLYAGRPVSDDHRFGEPRRWFDSIGGSTKAAWAFDWTWWAWDLPDGCALVLVLIVGFTALLWAAWFVVEIAVPLVAFMLYFLVCGMLAQVLNDQHGCRAHLVRAMSRGALWATLYTAPLSGVVWLVHYVHGARG